MLQVTIPEQHYEFFNEETEEFVNVNIKEVSFQAEHSLLSLKKWEQRWHKPFLGNGCEDRTYEEMCDYIRCMTITPNIDPEIYHWIPESVMTKIVDYIKDPMSGTTIYENGLVGAQKSKNEIVSAEIIYYWMITLNVPVEFQKWHLNQLLTLIKVINIKNSQGTKESKMDKKTAAKQRAALNAARRAKYKSNG